MSVSLVQKGATERTKWPSQRVGCALFRPRAKWDDWRWEQGLGSQEGEPVEVSRMFVERIPV